MHVQGDALLPGDVFKNFRNMCLEIYEPDSAKLLPAPGSPWQAPLKKTKVKLNLLGDIHVLMMTKNRRNMSLYLSI